MFCFNKALLVLISLTFANFVQSDQQDGKRFFFSSFWEVFQNPYNFYVEQYPDYNDVATTEAYPDYYGEPTTEEQYPDYNGESTNEEQYPDYNGESTNEEQYPDYNEVSTTEASPDYYGESTTEAYPDYHGESTTEEQYLDYYAESTTEKYPDYGNSTEEYPDYGGDTDDNENSDNAGDNENNTNWGECSRSCGWGTQTRSPTKTTSDYRDCKLRDCPRETCSAPFHRRYGLRSHSCCDVTPLLSGGGVCGSSSIQTGVGNLIQRIVGGEQSAPKRFPWMVGITTYGTQHCGGVLINSNWVLSAAHCFVFDGGEIQSLSSIKMMFGTIDLTDTVKTNTNLQTSGVSQLVYKNYKFPLNDIALLRLTKPPRYTDYVQPICLPEGEILPDDANCVATGWGDKKMKGKNENIMDEVQIRLLPDDLCEKAYGERFFKNMMKCAGKIEGGIDTCQGDSGGPLMCQRCGSCQWVAYGVVSFGDGCALKRKPGVYVQVNHYADWIRSVTGMPKSGKAHEQCTKL